MSSGTITPASVSLKFSLVDNPRTQIVEWFEDLSAKARGLCVQWDPTGAITLIADAAYWNAMPGHITTAATPGHPAVYKDRPDFSPPAQGWAPASTKCADQAGAGKGRVQMKIC
jgi:hypothetical protein